MEEVAGFSNNYQEGDAQGYYTKSKLNIYNYLIQEYRLSLTVSEIMVKF